MVCCTIAAMAPCVTGDVMPTAMSQLPDSSMAYRQRVEDLCHALDADDRQGLTDEEAK
jgi:hypothetical protein